MMNKKRIALLIVSILFAIILMVIPSKASAATTLTTPLYFGINEFRKGTTPENMAYAIKNPYANGSTEGPIVGTKIWQIVKYDNKTSETYVTGNYYCVRSGVGFSDTNKKAEYNISYNFKTEKNAIASSGNTVLQSIVNNGYYNNLLALTDLLYLNGVSTDSERKALLDAAGIYNTDYYPLESDDRTAITAEYQVPLTDSDIEAVQQAAIWYFTNHDDELFEQIFNNYDENFVNGGALSKTSWLWYSTLERSQTYGENNRVDWYTSLSDYNVNYNTEPKSGDGLDRQEQAVLLYNYLINTANNNANSYADGTAVSKTKVTLYANATEQNTQPIILIEKEPETKEFDLALRKYITKVDDTSLTGESSRIPNIDESTLSTETTATYKHKKDPVTVKTGSIVTYNLTIYNEGEKAGRATKIVDQLPTGLKYKQINTSGFSADYDETTNRITITRNSNNTTNLEAYTEGNLQSETIEIECEVTAKPDSKNQKILTNVAWIAEEYDAVEKETITTEVGKDRDSEPATVPNVNKDNMSNYIGNDSNKTDLTDSTYYYKGKQDDDDFEKLVLEPAAFDLKLIKRIVEVNGTKVPERILNVDITALANGTATTATYDLDKTPVAVKDGDLVKYTFRIYNEGDIDGYASEITEDIPNGLEFIWSEKEGAELEADTTLTEAEKEAIRYNQGIWDIKTINTSTNKIELISTDYLAKGKGAEITDDGANLIKAFDSSKPYINTINDKNPDYKEVSVYLKVVEKDATETIIRNEAAITGDTDSDGNPVDDRDSQTDKWVKYEDDEDYDNVILQSFDLALRKFITGVDDKEVTSRIPQVKYDKENNQITYEHTKDPVEVSTGNIVTYTIRVYNEGEIDGFASKITDDIPDGLEYLPDNEINKEYRWVMYDSEGKETEDVSKAVKITTDYLSKEQGEARMKKNTEITENPALLTAFDKEQEISDTNPDYADVKIAFKVIEPNTSDRIIVNSAQISDDTDKDGNPIEDDDSTPDKWIDGEDDQDKEYVKLTYFDLALRKWVTQAIVIENGKETVTQTGHKPEDDPEQVVKVEINRKKVNSVTVKFKYSIRVTNEGDIAGYAKEVTDYVPEGLKFVASDNPDWKDEGNNVISTRKLENTLLQPGESADVEVILTWINGKDNMGLKINTAEISEDYNDRHVPDRDSTPDNRVPGEDDIDDAPVLLSISTGQSRIYFTLGFVVLITIASGIILIKRFVL